MLDDNCKQPYGPYITFAFIIALLVGATLASHSQGPSPSRGKQSHQVKPVAEDEATGPSHHQPDAQDPPVKVQIVPTPEQEADAAREQREEDEAATGEWRLVYWTFWLFAATLALVVVVGIQAGLFIWQLRLMKSDIEHTKTTAKAARLSAMSGASQARTARRDLVTSNRAWMFTQPWPHDYAEYIPETGEIKFKMEIRHYGNMPAKATGISVEFLSAPPQGEPRYNEKLEQTSVPLATSNRDLYPPQPELRYTAPKGAWYVVGRIRYRDEFQTRFSRYSIQLFLRPDGKHIGVSVAGPPAWSDYDVPDEEEQKSPQG